MTQHYILLNLLRSFNLGTTLDGFCSVGVWFLSAKRSSFLPRRDFQPVWDVKRDKKWTREDKKPLKEWVRTVSKVFLYFALFKVQVIFFPLQNILFHFDEWSLCAVGLSVRTCNLIEKLGSIFGNRSRTSIHLYVMHTDKA